MVFMLRRRLVLCQARQLSSAASQSWSGLDPNLFRAVERILKGDGETTLTSNRSSERVRELTLAWQEVQKTQDLIHDSQKIANDPKEGQELRSLAQEEVTILDEEFREKVKKLKDVLLPQDPIDNEDAILEIRAGVGGDEAGLFAADILRMYQRYSSIRGWNFQVLDISTESGPSGGVREATANVKGTGVFGALRNEAGVHRVQRVPKTETSGRLHTSTIALVVLPDKNSSAGTADDLFASGQLERDTRIDLYRAGGKGGQNVNKVETAVRLTHGPSGIVVTMQDTRSQFQNKERAWQVLRARLLDRHLVKKAEEERASRRDQVTTVTRSDKTRTYNYPQNRVTDHRTGYHLYDLQGCLQGQSLDLIIENVRQWQEVQRLEALLKE